MDEPINITEHLTEFRKRLLWCVYIFLILLVATFSYSSFILEFLVNPLKSVMQEAGGSNRIIFTSLTEGFVTDLKIAVTTAIMLSMPFILIQIWMFIRPALTEKEAKYLTFLFVFPPFLFLLGIALAYFYIIPLAWKFFMSFQNLSAALPIELEPRLLDYINLSLSFLFSFGLAFQLPLIILVLVFLNIVSAASLIKIRKYVIFIIFVASAILTPPDIISQFCLAVPLIFLYEISILIAKRFEKNKNIANQKNTL